MNASLIKDIATSILASLGSLAVAKGYLDQDTLLSVVGAIGTLLSFGLSFVFRKAEAKPAA